MKITESRIRRIIREELLREQVFDGPPIMDPSVHAEWEKQILDSETGETVADRMRKERLEDDFFNPISIIASAASSLIVDSAVWTIDLLYSGVELRAHLAAYLFPVEGDTTTQSEHLKDATDAAYEVAIGNLAWYGLGALGPLGRKLKRKIPGIKKSKATEGKPTPAQQEDLVKFRTEVLTDDVVSASGKDAKKVAEVIDGAIEANKRHGFKKPATPASKKETPRLKPTTIDYFDDLPTASGYLAPQTVKYNISHEGQDLTVVLYKETQSSAVDITFVPANASWDYSMTGKGRVRELLDKVVDSVKSYNKQFPEEKNFVFSGVPHGTGWLGKGSEYATKRDKAYNLFMRRKIKSDPELSDIVSSTGYQTIKGHDGHPQGVTVITLKEMRMLINEIVRLL